MNFLAHLYLSGSNEKIQIGNFIGDFVKGNQLTKYEKNIQKGIRLHRSIDTFTDTHPIVFDSKKKLRPDFGHYSPVIIDVFYDHFLAVKWADYSTKPLLEYTENIYQTIANYEEIIPKAASNMLFYMKRDNWLYHYQFLEGIDRSLKGMAKRTRFDSKMEVAIKSLEKYYEEFKKEFDVFFPALRTHVNQFLNDG